MSKEFSTVTVNPKTKMAGKMGLISQTADQSSVADKIINDKSRKAETPQKPRRGGAANIKDFLGLGGSNQAVSEESKELVKAAVEMSQAQRAYDSVRESALSYAYDTFRILSADQHDVFVKPARIRNQIANERTPDRISINPSIIEFVTGSDPAVNGQVLTGLQSVTLKVAANMPYRFLGWTIVAETIDTMQSPGTLQVRSQVSASGTPTVVDSVTFLLPNVHDKGHAAFIPGVRSQKIEVTPNGMTVNPTTGDCTQSSSAQDIDGDIDISFDVAIDLQVSGTNVRVYAYPIVLTSEVQDAMIAQLDTGAVSSLVKQFVTYIG